MAPTGTISLLACTTSGIEPIFALAYERELLGAAHLEVHPLFERVIHGRGLHTRGLLAEVARTGRVRGNPKVPADLQAAFVTALEVAPHWHVRIQAAVQRHVDAAVSKTVNMAASATPDDVAAVFLHAWRAGAKGITVYRDGSRADQVLRGPSDNRPARVAAVYTGGCQERDCHF